MRSSTEAEFRSKTLMTVELDWLSSVLSELGIMVDRSMVIHYTNMGATHFATNSMYNTKM